MPIYEYYCADCDRSFELFLRPGEHSAECPQCKGTKLRRELSVFSSGSTSEAAQTAGGAGAAACCGGGCGCR